MCQSYASGGYGVIALGIKADRGFVGLVAKPGMGKTTLLCQLLKELNSSAETAFIFQTQCDAHERRTGVSPHQPREQFPGTTPEHEITMSRNFELLEQIEQEQKRSVVVSIAAPANPNTGGFDESAYAKEEISKLVQRIFWPFTETGKRTVVFCGVDDGRRSETICLDVARELASHISDSVCVVNAKSSNGGEHLGAVSPSRSWSDEPLRYGSQIGSNLWLIPAGTVCNGNGLPSVSNLHSQLEQVRKTFAYVLIDARPVGLYADTALLAQLADGVVLVVEANGTRRTAARTAKETLEGAGACFLGIVLSNRSFPIPEALYRRL